MTEALPVPDSLAAWIAHYQRHAVAGTRPPAAAAKIGGYCIGCGSKSSA